MNYINIISKLPDEVSLQIFSNLSPKDLASCSQVCSDWKKLVGDNSLWKPFVKNNFNIDERHIENYKQYYVDNIGKLKSNDEIFKRIEAFTDRISLGQNGRFICRFSHLADSKYRPIKITLKGKFNKKVPQNLNKFDVEIACEIVNPINNGSLTIPNNVPVFKSALGGSMTGSECTPGTYRTYRMESPHYGPFQYYFEFPNLKYPVCNFNNKSDLEKRICELLNFKIRELANQKAWKDIYKKAAIVATISSVVLLSSFIFWMRNSG